MLSACCFAWIVVSSMVLSLAGLAAVWVLTRPPSVVHSVKGKRILITGAAMGIGKEMALRFAAEGAHLVLWDINLQQLQIAKEEIEKQTAGAVVHVYKCDVTDRDAVLACGREVEEELGESHVEVLVNNAGVVSGKQLLELSERDIRRTFAVNVLAHFWTVQAFLPRMLERDSGQVVTIASTCGIFGAVGLSDYCASKHAVMGFHESLRLEIRRKKKPGVSTTVICPNKINTGMFDGAEQNLQWLVPVLEPGEVADAVVTAVKKKTPQRILPWQVEIGAGVASGILPLPLKDYGMDIFGVSTGMDTFTGRKAT